MSGYHEKLFLLRKISEFPSGTRTDNLLIAGEMLWVRVPLGNSDIFLSKNSSKNIMIIINNIYVRASIHLTLEYTILFLWGHMTIVLFNKQNNTWMFGNMKLFFVLNRESHGQH